ncbi:MAG: trigger factor, partial [Lachnospiraceae bacterium]
LTIGEYKGIEIDIEEPTVTEEEIENYINYILTNSATTEEITDRTVVAEGDIANIDFEGKKDGVAFDGGTSQGYDLTIGSGSFIEGFEAGLIGANVGDTLDLALTFPETYSSEELAGADVVFTVKVNSISKKVDAELNDEFVVGLAIEGTQTVDEFKEYIYNILYEEAYSSYTTSVEDAVIAKILENSKFSDVPEELITYYANIIQANIESQATYYGMELEAFVKAYFGMEMDEFEERKKEGGKESAMQAMIFKKIAELESIEVTDEIIDEDIKASYAALGYETAEAYKETVDTEAYRDYLVSQKVLSYLVENVTFVQSEAVQETVDGTNTEE